MKRCTRCGKNPKAVFSHSYCLNCHAEKTREWRKTHPLTPEQRKKDICRSYTAVLVKRGHLIKKPCEICGQPAQAHHPDYNNPRLVTWLCRPHHMEEHKKLNSTANKYPWIYVNKHLLAA